MKINYEKEKISGKYDKRNLSISESGTNRYPSKKMFVEFLKKFPDVKANASIWSLADYAKNEVTITVEVKYKVRNAKRIKKADKITEPSTRSET